MRLPSPAGGPTHASTVSYTLHWLLDWGRRLTQTFFKFTIYIPSRAKGEGPVSVVNQSGFAHPLRSTVTRLTTAPCNSSSGRRKLNLVLRYCLFMFQTPIFT